MCNWKCHSYMHIYYKQVMTTVVELMEVLSFISNLSIGGCLLVKLEEAKESSIT
jgi:hypothetical protein